MRLINNQARFEWWEHFYWTRTRDLEFHTQPRLVGYAWRDFDTSSTIYIIVPLNVLVAAARWLWWRLAWIWPQAMMKPLLHIYRLGQQDGFEKGRYNKEVVRGASEILRAEGLDTYYKE